MRRIEINKGDKFGRLTIIKEIEKDKTQRKFKCKCECGNITDVLLSNLRSGNSKSCGCLGYENAIKSKITHGMSKGGANRFYGIYNSLKKRCNNINDINYGGRGIKNEWQDFIEFKNDMYESYLKHCKEFGEKETTIDRIDVNGNYCKENCRWATNKEQANNTRTNTFYKYKGKIQTLSQWCDELGLIYNTINSRIIQYGYTFEQAILKKRWSKNYPKK